MPPTNPSAHPVTTLVTPPVADQMAMVANMVASPPAAPPDPAARIAALEAELAALRTEMQDFTFTVSHDLRASLRHIISYAQLVQEDAAPLLSAEVQGFLQTISDSARHMGHMMDGLMELSRLGTVPVHLGPVSLQTLVTDVRDALQSGYPAHPVQWQISPNLPTVQADPVLLSRALHHVLDNALKFTTHTPAPTIGIRATPAPTPGSVRLTIQDNGAGYNTAIQNKLFHPFQRLHTTKQFPGIGMGLALTRKIMQRMGGAVQIQGQPGKGCIVWLEVVESM